MYVGHIQLARKAPRGNQIVAGAEGADLGAPIGAHRPGVACKVVAIQHLDCSRSCQDAELRSVRARHAHEPAPTEVEQMWVRHLWARP